MLQLSLSFDRSREQHGAWSPVKTHVSCIILIHKPDAKQIVGSAMSLLLKCAAMLADNKSWLIRTNGKVPLCHRYRQPS